MRERPSGFFEGWKFEDWMSLGPLLWIHGKRKLLSYFTAQNLIISNLTSGIRQEHSLVRHLS
jgi:hypothetical protein